MTPALLFLGILLAIGYWLLATRPTPMRLAAYAALLLSAAAMCVMAFGTPRPSMLQLRSVDGDLLAYALDEGHAVYLWLTPDGDAVPVYLALPWSQQTAAKLEQAQAESQRTGRKMRVGVRGEAQRGTGEGGGKKLGHGDSLTGPDDPIDVTLAPVPPMQPKDAT